ncbi:MAG TPA: type II toxin-antitoxin system VapC family toxin [Anaerolineae bacterium]|nr:type II toxin-antitoxin system VapC family toxin [Anaerolineae bacterium]
MKYMLDTNICIYLIKQKPPQLLRKFAELSFGDVGVSAITVAELQYGVQKSQYPEQNQQALGQLLIPLTIVDFDHNAAVAYGAIRAALERQGTPIGSLDTLIAAHAQSLDVTLVTNNVREFSRVPDLKVVNWAEH